MKTNVALRASACVDCAALQGTRLQRRFWSVISISRLTAPTSLPAPSKSGVGFQRRAVLGFFDWETKKPFGKFLSPSRSKLSPSLATSPLGQMANRRSIHTLSSAAPTAPMPVSWAAAMPFSRAKPSMLLTASSPLSSTRT